MLKLVLFRSHKVFVLVGVERQGKKILEEWEEGVGEKMEKECLEVLEHMEKGYLQLEVFEYKVAEMLEIEKQEKGCLEVFECKVAEMYLEKEFQVVLECMEVEKWEKGFQEVLENRAVDLQGKEFWVVLVHMEAEKQERFFWEEWVYVEG